MSTDKAPWPFQELPNPALDSKESEIQYRVIRQVLYDELGDAASSRLARKIAKAIMPAREFTDASGVKWREVKDV